MILKKTAWDINDFLLSDYSGVRIYCHSQSCSSSHANMVLKVFVKYNNELTPYQGVTVVLKQLAVCI